jgi:hypothetical protein
MAPLSLRRGSYAAPARRRRTAGSYRLRCETLEDRTVPTNLFTVQNAFTPSLANNPGCVAVGDLNKDGIMDAVISNYGDPALGFPGDSITVLKGLAGGGFATQNLLTNGEVVSFVTIADVNGDTWPDVVAINQNTSGDSSVSVFKNNASSALSLSLNGTFDSFSQGASWVGLADITGDGKLDVVVASYGADNGSGGITGNNMTIFQGNGDFTFSPTPTSPSPLTTLAPDISFIPTCAVVADFDGDGKLDIAATVPTVPPTEQDPQGAGSIWLFKGTGSGGFAAPNQYATGNGANGVLPINIQAADLDGDGKLDLVVANAGDPNATNEFSGNSVGVLLNTSSTGNPSFGFPTDLTANAHGTFAVAVADFDLDGKADIAAINYGGYQTTAPPAFVAFFKGDGTGSFNPGSPATYPTGGIMSGGQYVAAGDFDQNGTPDLITVHADGSDRVLINTSVPPVATSIDLGSSQNPSTSGQSVTFTATVNAQTGTASGGTVQFYNNGSPIGAPVALDANHQAQLITSTLSVGTHTIKATYSGATGFGGSSNTLSQVVNPAVVSPTVTITKAAGQADPTNASPITFTVQFSEAVTGFDGSDIDFTGSTVGGTLAAGVTGSGANYTVTVTGMSGTGTVKATVKAGAAVSGGGGSSTASSPATVSFDADPPTVSVGPAAGQPDPTGSSSIKFTVTFSESVTGFTAADVSLGGTAGGTLQAAVTGSGAVYTVTVTGMTSPGSVTVAVPAGGAADAAGNTNTASTTASIQYVDTGILSFSQPVFDTTEDSAAHTMTVTVTRTGGGAGSVSINYATSDGTAHSGGPRTGGQADYTPTSGSLSWTDGETGPKTFTVEILPDTLNEGRELINLTLSGATGSIGAPGLGTTTAAVAIAPNDPQGPGTYLDQDGDKVTIRLTGQTGSLQFYRTDPDGDGRGPIELIVLNGTMPDPAHPRANLVIAVAKAKTSTDGGTVQLGGITGSGLRGISARKANLTGDGIDGNGYLDGIHLNGYLGSLLIGNITDGADVTTLANPTNPLLKTRINTLLIGDGTAIDVGAPISGLTATGFGAGSLRVPSIGTMMVRGRMKADVTVTGAGVDPTKKALGLLRVTGDVTGSDIMVNGNVGTVVVGAFRDSRMFVGYSGPDDGTGTFAQPGFTVGTFRANGKFDDFQNSRVIATAFKSVSIANYFNSPDVNTEFGFYADVSLGKITVSTPVRWAYNASLPTPQGLGIGWFVVQLV